MNMVIMIIRIINRKKTMINMVMLYAMMYTLLDTMLETMAYFVILWSRSSIAFGRRRN